MGGWGGLTFQCKLCTLKQLDGGKCKHTDSRTPIYCHNFKINRIHLNTLLLTAQFIFTSLHLHWTRRTRECTRAHSGQRHRAAFESRGESQTGKGTNSKSGQLQQNTVAAKPRLFVRARGTETITVARCCSCASTHHEQDVYGHVSFNITRIQLFFFFLLPSSFSKGSGRQESFLSRSSSLGAVWSSLSRTGSSAASLVRSVGPPLGLSPVRCSLPGGRAVDD